ncbi:RES family NAD+ phosphorylase [Nitrincola nitratireducens]|uniref:RES domain protein n=1 Tax=Nitrincola nitratireducens TaxID=1229521 RepID=W9URC0_9GAMM|nr:RES family NAD+ phosphorylase [Nitrincola nitratireducens]EXJ09768.1 RES domain protein [Nitrincola nitratireducens]
MIWSECEGEGQIKPIEGVLFRLVENQEQAATLSLVDTLEEQSLLEDLLETSKPSYPNGAFDHLHYLLKTPFRYPPLKWGSRFGRTHEPSLFYGGLSIESTLSESAYYRFVFLRSMLGNPPSEKLRTEHCLFSVAYQTVKGIQLQVDPFNQFKQVLCHPTDYASTQALGSDMRLAGVEAFEYRSARLNQDELCCALFTPKAFVDHQPKTQEHWFCEITQAQVTFKAIRSQRIFQFQLTDFLIYGRFPLPA